MTVHVTFLLKIFLLGIGCAAGQPPLSLWPVTLLSLVGFFYLLRQNTLTLRLVFQSVSTFGFAYFLVTMHWIIEPFLVDIPAHGWLAPFALILMAAGLSIFWGLGAISGWCLIQKTHLGLALGIGIVEVLRGFLFTGFPWGLIGYVWINTPIAQLSAFVGIYGLTILTVFASALAVLPRTGHIRALSTTALLGVIGLAWGGGLYRIAQSGLGYSSEIVRLAQPNASQELKWDPDHTDMFFERLLAQTRAEPKPDLVIWPESALPLPFEFAEDLLVQLSDTAQGTPVLLGALRIQEGRYFNSIVYLNSKGEATSVYDKHHLVPFGEYLPFEAIMGRIGLSVLVEPAGAGFATGEGPLVVEIDKLGKVLPLICYEAVFPQDVSSAPSRADVMVQLTNDAWFGNFSGPQQHLAKAQMRSVEQGVSLLRVANTGITAVIDPLGRVNQFLPLNETGYIDVLVAKPLHPTPYSRFGLWNVVIMGVILCIFCILNDLFLRRVDAAKE